MLLFLSAGPPGLFFRPRGSGLDLTLFPGALPCVAYAHWGHRQMSATPVCRQNRIGGASPACTKRSEESGKTEPEGIALALKHESAAKIPPETQEPWSGPGEAVPDGNHK